MRALTSRLGDEVEVPAAPFYVLSDDRFFSGWGPARDKTNTVILPCQTREEAETVADNANGRSEQENVRIVTELPEEDGAVLYSLLTRKTAARWYSPGSWTAG